METQYFPVEDLATFRQQALRWASRQEPVLYLNPNDLAYPHGAFRHLLAVGARRVLPVTPQFFDRLADFHQGRWLFGYFGYDLKNQLERLHSHHPDRIGFPDAFFFEPLVLLFLDETRVGIGSDQPQSIYEAIRAEPRSETKATNNPVQLRASVDRATYVQNVAHIRQHIEEGDVYELNYCTEFFAEEATLDPLATYLALNARSPTPFSAFLRLGERYLMCASPERFLKKEGAHIISQPIKGTIPRSRHTMTDARLRHALYHSPKERAENMMIVDLVRNDLARSAQPGTVQVDELFGIYPFRHLHQMISTISAQLRPDLSFVDAIRCAFPMGSMTGAPKIRAMALIEQYENRRRGLFSGAVGYMTPEGDFDFNVVIRSLFYHTTTQTLSFQVGSAITYDSVAAREWDECQLKARAIREVLEKRL
ncbi:para-aminobenzoate synthetase component 1 [Catalinimonas alkaloidigena]|uniref:Para-aminobenzoate synthetase component 1 n=1 Tax=Catalinimonas alkaloidigena TaxID=1075417 RepID=A0A1G9S2E6_9BACT|nr:aminodeoxychorismate synthase component I [Catalinimonas alkaloidigena]SDM29641.1 para-aminobenzoate synthetase component 1 [Catalinimonas alkaloidigena]